jgi:hypothetical protein
LTFINWETVKLKVRTQFAVNKPTHVAGGEITNVPHLDMSDAVRRQCVTEWLYATRTNGDISALQDTHFPGLIANAEISYDPQADSRKSQDGGVERDRIVRRPLPDSLKYIFLLVVLCGGCLLALILWVLGGNSGLKD